MNRKGKLKEREQTNKNQTEVEQTDNLNECFILRPVTMEDEAEAREGRIALKEGEERARIRWLV